MRVWIRQITENESPGLSLFEMLMLQPWFTGGFPEMYWNRMPELTSLFPLNGHGFVGVPHDWPDAKNTLSLNWYPVSEASLSRPTNVYCCPMRTALLLTQVFTFVPMGSAVAVWKSLLNVKVSPTWTLIVPGKNSMTPTFLPLPAEVSPPTWIVYVVPAAEAGVGRRIRLASNARMASQLRFFGTLRCAIRMGAPPERIEAITVPSGFGNRELQMCLPQPPPDHSADSLDRVDPVGHGGVVVCQHGDDVVAPMALDPPDAVDPPHA